MKVDQSLRMLEMAALCQIFKTIFGYVPISGFWNWFLSVWWHRSFAAAAVVTDSSKRSWRMRACRTHIIKVFQIVHVLHAPVPSSRGCRAHHRSSYCGEPSCSCTGLGLDARSKHPHPCASGEPACTCIGSRCWPSRARCIFLFRQRQLERSFFNIDQNEMKNLWPKIDTTTQHVVAKSETMPPFHVFVNQSQLSYKQ